MTVISTTKDTGRPDPHPGRRVRRQPGSGLGGVGGPAQARALVGTADVPGDIHPPRLRRRGRVPLLHDRPGR